MFQHVTAIQLVHVAAVSVTLWAVSAYAKKMWRVNVVIAANMASSAWGRMTPRVVRVTKQLYLSCCHSQQRSSCLCVYDDFNELKVWAWQKLSGWLCVCVCVSACRCHPLGSVGSCDQLTGTCECDPMASGPLCDRCLVGHICKISNLLFSFLSSSLNLIDNRAGK